MAGLLGPYLASKTGMQAGMGLLTPEEEERQAGFWQGGDKFGGRDALAGLLAVIGDVAAQQSGGQAGAVGMLTGTRMSAMDDLKKQAAQEQKMRELIAIGQANGLSEGQVRMQAAGLEGPEQPKQHELQQLASLANDPTQPPEVREAAKRKLADDPYLTGVNLPSGGQYFGRASGLPGVAGSLGGNSPPPGLQPMSPDEIRSMGLPEGGPGGNRPGGFLR